MLLDQIESELNASMAGLPPSPFVMDVLSRTFEVFQFVEREYPDDIAKWPPENVSAADRAVARLLAENPGTKVIEDRTSCISRDHPRFPETDQRLEDGPRFGLHRVVLLSED